MNEAIDRQAMLESLLGVSAKPPLSDEQLLDLMNQARELVDDDLKPYLPQPPVRASLPPKEKLGA